MVFFITFGGRILPSRHGRDQSISVGRTDRLAPVSGVMAPSFTSRQKEDKPGPPSPPGPSLATTARRDHHRAAIAINEVTAVRHHNLYLLFVSCLILSACGGDDPPAVAAPPADVCPEPESPAPNLVLTDLDGATHDLSAYRCEKVVVLDFWASWCGPCRVGMPLLQELHETYADEGLLVLAVNLAENEQAVRTFITEGGYTFPVLLDPDQVGPTEYEITGIPRQVIIDAAGEVRYDRTGLNSIAHIDHHAVLPGLLAELPE